MKKRLIGLLLVLVILATSLVSCGYSFAKDDLTKYATFSGKADFEKELLKIAIKDGDFTTNDDEREKRVLDDIFGALANAADKEDHKTAGIPGTRDLAYYSYYATADFDGETAMFFASAMNDSKAVTVQLGLSSYGEDGVAKNVAEFLKGYDFSNGVYTSAATSSDTAAAGDTVFVTYTYSYIVTENGVQTEKSGTYTNYMMVVGEAPAEGQKATTLASHLAGKKVNTTLDKLTITEQDKGEVSYSNIKINWIAKSGPAHSFKNTTYTEENKLKDTTGTERDLKDKELTYYVYPTYYVSIPEFSAKNIVDVILGDEIKVDSIYQILFGEDYANLDEKEDKDKITERAEWLINYKSADGKTIATLVDDIVKLFDTIATAEKSEKDADTSLTNLKKSVEDLKEDLKEEEDKPEDQRDQNRINSIKADILKAEEKVATAETTLATAKQTTLDKKAEKDAVVKALLDITADNPTIDGETQETVAVQLERGYKVLTYNYLQNIYNEEIRMNLAKEIYYFLTKNIDVTGTPEKAVERTYERLMENYEYKFYEESDSTTKESYYKKYDGSFKKFLKAIVTEEIETVTTYDAAKAAVKKKAEEYVTPIVKIYVASKAYGVVATDKEFEAYKKDTDNNYSYNEYAYGENSVLYAYQFDKLMNFFLKYEEQDETVGIYKKVTFKYVSDYLGEEGGPDYVIGEPKSYEKQTTEE